MREKIKRKIISILNSEKTVIIEDDDIFVIIPNENNDYGEKFNKLILKNIGLSRDEIQMILNLSSEDILDCKKVIKIQKIKKQLKDLQEELKEIELN